MENKTWLEELANEGQLKILCGAGISLNSGVPLANDILKYLFMRVGFNEDDAWRLIEQKVPFEDWIQLFITSRIHGDHILDLFSADELCPGENHRMIAKLVAAGVVRDVYTANFDTLIEQALIDEGLKADTDFKVFYKESQFAEINACDCARVIKFHGSAHDRESIRITLDRITAQGNLTDRFQAISPIFSHEGTNKLLVMGYSCSDIWDVQPCMKNVPFPHADIFYIKHTGAGLITEERLESWPTEEFTEYHGYEINGETTHILRTICECFKIPVTADEHTSIGWENLMKKYMEPYFQWFLSDEDYKLLQIRILQRISAYADAADILNDIDNTASWAGFSLNRYHREAEILMHTDQQEAAHKVYRQELVARLTELAIVLKQTKFVALAMNLPQEDSYKEELFDELKKELGKPLAYVDSTLVELIGAFLGDCASLNEMGEREVALKNLELLEDFFNTFQNVLQFYRSDAEVWPIKAAILNEQALSCRDIGDYSTAQTLFENAIEIKRQYGDSDGIANSLDNLAGVYIEQSDIASARTAVKEALNLRLKLNHSQKTFRSLYNLLLVSFKINDLELLESGIQTAKLFLAQNPGFRTLLNPLFPLAIAQFENRQYQSAIGSMMDLIGDSISEENRDIVKQTGRTIINAAQFQQAIGEYQKAYNSYSSACFLFKKAGYEEGVGGCLRSAGILYETSGQAELAMDYYRQSLECMKNASIQKARTLAQIGLCYGRCGDMELGIQYTNDAIKMFTEFNDFESVKMCEKQKEWFSGNS